jgi:heme exporter protein A
MPVALEVEHLTRRFGRTVAVDDLSLGIDAGEAVALFGPNGAGKTTFLRLCATLLRPTRGRVRVFGLDAAESGMAVRRRIAMLAHESYLYPDLTPLENLRFHARLFGARNAEARIRFLVERLGLLGWSQRPVRTLSRGLVQRCALARVLLHEPDLLFLDEPFTGLDIEAQTTLAEVLAEAHRRGTTLLMSTHDLAAGLALCTSALVLARGRSVAHEAVAATERAAFERRYRALVQPPDRGQATHSPASPAPS